MRGLSTAASTASFLLYHRGGFLHMIALTVGRGSPSTGLSLFDAILFVLLLVTTHHRHLVLGGGAGFGGVSGTLNTRPG